MAELKEGDIEEDPQYPCDIRILKRINWDYFKGTSKQKAIFKYLACRCSEIKDRNTRCDYMDKIDVTITGSLKKSEYKAMFDVRGLLTG